MKSSFDGDCLKISIGNCQINLPAAEQDELRQALTKSIKEVFFDEENTKEILQAKLDAREFIFLIWHWLKDDEFSALLQHIPTNDLLMLIRYMRSKTPNLLKRIRSFWDESTEEDLMEQMGNLDKIPAILIIKILDDIYAYLLDQFGDVMPAMPPENYKEAESKARFDDIAAYVKALPGVPPDRARVILDCLDTKQRVKILGIANKHKWKDFDAWFTELESQKKLEELQNLAQRLPPQPLWEEMQILEAIYNLMAPGAATNVSETQEETQTREKIELPLLLEKKAKDFLHKLGKLSQNNLQVLLKHLTKTQMVRLLALIEDLGITNLHEGMHSCLPARIYDQLVINKPDSIGPNEVQELLKDINDVIKKLKN